MKPMFIMFLIVNGLTYKIFYVPIQSYKSLGIVAITLKEYTQSNKLKFNHVTNKYIGNGDFNHNQKLCPNKYTLL